MRIASVVFVSLALALAVSADIPVHCVHEQVVGTWEFGIHIKGDSDLRCEDEPEYDETVMFELHAGKAATRGDGAECKWTMIYDQGMEIKCEDVVYFSFFRYQGSESLCHMAGPGYVHNADGPSPTNWGCFAGKKVSNGAVINITPRSVSEKTWTSEPHNQEALVEEIHARTSLWTATVYPEDKMSILQDSLAAQANSPSLHDAHHSPREARSSPSPKYDDPPESFDWRDVEGTSYVTPVRDQGRCGSCWAFAVTASMESRIAVQTGGDARPVLSPQDLTSCGDRYTQGCEGGLKYLASKQMSDYGVVEEECFPYNIGAQCSDRCDPSEGPGDLWFAKPNYHYIGGWYGACGQDDVDCVGGIIHSTLEHGPTVVDFMVHSDFLQYKGGIYHHTGADAALGLYKEVNHSVVVVGWGSEDGVDYWIVKNSWGDRWGEDGYFRIVKGTDECAIEYSAVCMNPVLE